MVKHERHRRVERHDGWLNHSVKHRDKLQLGQHVRYMQVEHDKLEQRVQLVQRRHDEQLDGNGRPVKRENKFNFNTSSIHAENTIFRQP